MSIHRRAFDQRLVIAALLFLCCVGIIIGRLCYLQIAHREQFLDLSIRNFTRFTHVPYPRGNIVDRHGHLLATNRPMANVIWVGSGKSSFTSEQLQAIAQLENILGISLQEKLKNIAFTERLQREIELARDIPFEQVTKIAELFAGNTNIKLEHHFERYYPQGSLASHVVGYLGKYDIEAIGKAGLEKRLNEQLKGSNALERRTIDSVGRALEAQRVKDGAAGTTIITTLDFHLQQAAEEVFGPEFKGTFILMNPENGAVRVFLSRPNFDPSIFLRPIDATTWQELQQTQPFINRALGASYPPASLFKLITLSVAFDNGIINASSKFFCPGHVSFCGRKYRCAKKEGHGWLDVEESLAKSCNVMFFEIGKRISIDTLASYAERFGLGRETGVIFEEKTGLVPSTSWKLRTKGERWWPGETLSAAIGQSYWLVTPLQMARMYSAIFQGYLVRPRLLEEEPIDIETLAVRPETRAFLKKTMKAVVQSGTAAQLGRVHKTIEAYFKTGTAQVSTLELREADKKYLEHGWLVGTFKYKDYEPLTLVILLENVGSSSIARGVAQKFLSKYKRIVDSSPELFKRRQPAITNNEKMNDTVECTSEDALISATLQEEG